MPKFTELPVSAGPTLDELICVSHDPGGSAESQSATLQQVKDALQQNVIHTDVANEINGIPAKVSPVAADVLVIEDSEDSGNKKSIQVSNLPSGVPLAHAASHENGGGDPIDHDSLTGFVSDEHINHTAVTITGVESIDGGGDISANLTLKLVNDEDVPGAKKYYGTNELGVKGYFDVNESFPRHQTYQWTLNGNVIVGATQDGGRPIPRDMTITNVLIFRGQGGNSGQLIVDINYNVGGVAPVTLYTTQANRPTVDNSDPDWFVDTATLPDIVSILGGGFLTVDVDSVESGGGGTKNVTILVEAQVF